MVEEEEKIPYNPNFFQTRNEERRELEASQREYKTQIR